LLELPDALKRYLIDGSLSGGHGKALLALQGNPLQARLAQRVASEGLSVRETEDLVRRYGAMTESVLTRSSTTRERPASAIEAQRRLADRLQTRVRIDTGKRKGKIVIDFVSLDELDRLVQTIAGQDDSK
jgi:ParB family chromosome partitioning protein